MRQIAATGASVAMSTHTMAADLGGTNIRTALVDTEGQVAHRRLIPTQAEEGREAVIGRLVAEFDRVRGLAGARSLAGIGVSVASPTDPESGIMHDPPNLPGWDGFSLKPVLEERFSLTTSIANDATLAALAEHRHGAGRGYRNVVYLTVSTGIGGGLVIDDKLYAGARGFAGELGHIIIDIDPNGPRCGCGNTGCLEALCSGTAVARIARERLVAGEPSVMLDIAGGDAASVDARAVASAALAGDGLAKAIMDEVSTNLGIGLVSILHSFDPDVIVIGGGMSQNLEMMLPRITEEIDRRAMAHQRGRVPLVRSELGDDVSLLGAAALAFAAFDEARQT